MTSTRWKWSLLCVVLLGLGCTSKQEKHDKEVEAAWAAVKARPFVSTEDDVKAFEEFLAKYPSQGPLGNKRAADAQLLLDSARNELAMRAAEQAREAAEVAAEEARQEQRAALIEKARPALAPLVAKTLFSLACRAEPQNHFDDPEPFTVAALQLDGERLITRGRFSYSLWGLRSWLTDYDPDAERQLRKTLGVAVYDPTTHKVDPEALEALLAASWVEPDAAFLGAKARDAYLLFRPIVRAQARLYRVIDEQRDAIKAYESAFGQRLANLTQGDEEDPDRPDGEEGTPDEGELVQQLFANDNGPPFGSTATDYVFDLSDRRLFYRAVTDQLSLDRKAGIRRPEFDYLDVGFWLRRVDDGSAPVLGAFLERVLSAYDPDYKRELDGMRGEWPAPRKPVLGERSATELSAAGEAPPPIPPPPTGKLEGDRVLSYGLSSAPYAAAFDDEALSVIVSTGLMRYSRADGRRLFAMGLNGPQRASFSGDGRRFVIATRQHGKDLVQLFDSSRAQLVQEWEGLATTKLLLDQDGSRVGITLKNGDIIVRSPGAAPLEAAADAGAEVAAPAPAKLPKGVLLALIPTPRALLIASGVKLQVVDEVTGDVLASYTLKSAYSSIAASLDGSSVVTTDADSIIVTRYDAAQAKFSEVGRVKVPESTTAYVPPNSAHALVSGSWGRIWPVRLSDGKLEPGFVGYHPQAVTPDGKHALIEGAAQDLLLYSLVRGVPDAGTP